MLSESQTLQFSIIAAAAVTLAASLSYAGASAQSDAGAMTASLTMGEIMEISGWPMYVLVLMSFVAAALVVYLFIVLRTEQVVPASLCSDLPQSLKSGSLKSVTELCAAHPSPLASVVLAAIGPLDVSAERRIDILNTLVEAEGTRQAENIQGQTRYLMDIAAITPMIGLLGTVLGMVKAFRGVALDEAMARPIVLADGVQQALYTTAAGLLIAVPAMACYALLREKAGKLVSELESESVRLLANMPEGGLQ